MNTGRTVFSQIMDLLPHRDFRKCAKRYQGDRKIQKFSCMDQFLCMAFAQLTYRESLQNIKVCLRGNPSKLYHSGIRSHIITLIQWNNHRSEQLRVHNNGQHADTCKSGIKDPATKGEIDHLLISVVLWPHFLSFWCPFGFALLLPQRFCSSGNCIAHLSQAFSSSFDISGYCAERSFCWLIS